MHITIKDYVLDSTAADKAGELISLGTMIDKSGLAPYMAVLDNVAVIGPLIVHLRKDLFAHAIDAQKGEVTRNFGSASPGMVKKQLEHECGLKKPGSYLFLWNMRALNFWHWSMESLTKIIMAEACGFDGYYVIPPYNEQYGFIRESLNLMDIPAHRIMHYDGKPWLLERLYLAQPINGNQALIEHPRIIEQLRKRLLDACMPTPYKFERLYIAREGDGLTRRVANETELLRCLFKYNFQRVVMERYSLKEQIQIAASANWLVAPHGAGMVHCMFMHPGALVIEMFNANYVNPCMLPVIAFLKHRYFMIPSGGINRGSSENIVANTFPIDVLLEREAANGSAKAEF